MSEFSNRFNALFMQHHTAAFWVFAIIMISLWLVAVGMLTYTVGFFRGSDDLQHVTNQADSIIAGLKDAAEQRDQELHRIRTEYILVEMENALPDKQLAVDHDAHKLLADSLANKFVKHGIMGRGLNDELDWVVIQGKDDVKYQVTNVPTTWKQAHHVRIELFMAAAYDPGQVRATWTVTTDDPFIRTGIMADNPDRTYWRWDEKPCFLLGNLQYMCERDDANFWQDLHLEFLSQANEFLRPRADARR